MLRKALFCILVFVVTACNATQPLRSNQIKTAQYFETIKASSPEKLQDFLYAIPKGADLHSHIAGATYAENLATYSIGKGFCIDTILYVAQLGTGCNPYFSLDNLPNDPVVRDATIDAWSMRNFNYNNGLGHDHFFSTFAKFGKLMNASYPQVLAEIMNRAGNQNTVYLELMDTFDGSLAGDLGSSLGWDSNFDRMYHKVMSSNQMPSIVYEVSKKIDVTTQEAQRLMSCGTNEAEPGCHVTVNFLYQVLRAKPPERVFTQFVLGFETAKQLKQIVGFNLVQAEDDPVALRDYLLQMRMIQFLRQKYPGTKISLHAGELNAQLAPPVDRTFHIQTAVEIAGANRIGHGVDVMQETNYANLLQKMAANKIMVEINLVSNQSILGVERSAHPLPTYLTYGVPTALSTDDEGVLRTDLTEQYVKAVQDFNLSYQTLQDMSRNSLEYSFLPGESLWENNGSLTYRSVNNQCAKDYAVIATPSELCQRFLNVNKKARLQWELEQRFWNFEAQVWGN